MRLGGAKHVYELASLARAKLNGSVGQGEQRVILTNTNIDAWMEASPPLANNDRTRRHGSAIKGLHAKSLCIGITAVPC